jgi:hypothetical protein
MHSFRTRFERQPHTPAEAAKALDIQKKIPKCQVVRISNQHQQNIMSFLVYNHVCFDNGTEL